MNEQRLQSHVQCTSLVRHAIRFLGWTLACALLILGTASSRASPVTINNITDNPTTFFTTVSGGPVSHFPPFFQIISLVDIPGTPWVSSSRIVESAGVLADSISIVWNIDHIFGPHPNDVNPNPNGATLSLSFTAAAVGVVPVSAVPFPVIVAHPLTDGNFHFDLFFLSMAVDVTSGTLGHLDINSYNIDYHAEHCEGNGVTTPCISVPGGIGGMAIAEPPTEILLIGGLVGMLLRGRRLSRKTGRNNVAQR